MIVQRQTSSERYVCLSQSQAKRPAQLVAMHWAHMVEVNNEIAEPRPGYSPGPAYGNALLAIWRRYELRLLKLLELFSFADTLADFNAAEQRQPGQQGRVKRPNVHSSAEYNVSLQVVFPLCSAIRRAGRPA